VTKQDAIALVARVRHGRPVKVEDVRASAPVRPGAHFAAALSPDAASADAPARAASVASVLDSATTLVGAASVSSDISSSGSGSGAALSSAAATSPAGARARPVLLRVQDACMTSEIFGSIKCDCKQQLDLSLAALAEAARRA
jgi:GTP cyclohydrolase II